VEGQYLVSQVCAARLSGVEVGFFRRAESEDEDSDEEGSRPAKAKRKNTQNPVVQIKEKLELLVERLDSHLVAYIWAKKSSLASATVTLVGRALAPLHEYKLQRKSTTWGVFDVLEGHRVCEMRLKFSASTTPAAVQKPLASDVRQTEVTVKWSPPLNDHGAPVVGYKISILLGSKQDEGPQWYTLCECTKSPNPIYVVGNLTGHTAYLVDIRAVNKVGSGDPCEFQITTAPVEPDPPSKPWIDEARDGCLNVAWHAPASDGGLPITAYRVRMRKILGASKWNPFGPGESTATWVDMGTVGAAMSEQAATSMYNAWVGPLEKTPCEYRFQVFCMSAAGESGGSELSEPQYT